MRSDEIGLRLCGIALEPFWPARNGSWTSPISVCWRLRISVREALQRAAGDGDRGQERGMPVALDDLRADRVDCQAKLRHDLRLDLGRELAIGSDRPGQLARREIAGGRLNAVAIPAQLERPRRELEAERDRLGVDRVGAAHHHRLGVLARLGHERRDQRVHLEQEQIAPRSRH